MEDQQLWRKIQQELDRVCGETDFGISGDPEVILQLLMSLPDGAGVDALVAAAEQLEADGPRDSAPE